MVSEAKATKSPLHDVVLDEPEKAAATKLGSSTEINASGHVQELDKNFNIWSIVSVAIVTGNTWAGLAGTIVSFQRTLVSCPFGGPREYKRARDRGKEYFELQGGDLSDRRLTHGLTIFATTL
jgi:hypothetical protein